MEEKIILLYNFLYDNNFNNCFDVDKITLGHIGIDDIKITDVSESNIIIDDLNKGKYSIIDYNEKENLIYLKQYSDTYPVTIKIGVYYNDVNELSCPSNNDALFSYLLSQLVINKKTKHILLPIVNFDIEFSKIQHLIKNTPIYQMIKEKMDFDEIKPIFSLRIREHFHKSKLLKEHLENNVCDYKPLLFQVIHTLAVLQKEFPSFRHNNLTIDNILVYIKKDTTSSNVYEYNDDKWTIPNIGFDIKITNFEKSKLSNFYGVVNQRDTEVPYINESNNYFDLHTFLNSLINGNHNLSLLNSSNNCDLETKKFLDKIIPTEYRYKDQKYLNNNVVIIQPYQLLNHPFFKDYKNVEIKENVSHNTYYTSMNTNKKSSKKISKKISKKNYKYTRNINGGALSEPNLLTTPEIFQTNEQKKIENENVDNKRTLKPWEKKEDYKPWEKKESKPWEKKDNKPWEKRDVKPWEKKEDYKPWEKKESKPWEKRDVKPWEKKEDYKPWEKKDYKPWEKKDDIKSNQTESETKQTDTETKQTETDTKQTETDTKQTDTETKQTDSETNMETKQTDSEIKFSDLDNKQIETENKQSELDVKPWDKKDTKSWEKKESKPLEKKDDKPWEKKESKPWEKKESKPWEKKDEKPWEKKYEKPWEKKDDKPWEKKDDKPWEKKEIILNPPEEIFENKITLNNPMEEEVIPPGLIPLYDPNNTMISKIAPFNAYQANPSVNKIYNISLNDPLGNHSVINRIYEDVLPSDKTTYSFIKLEEREVIKNFMRNSILQKYDREEFTIKGSESSLLSWIKIYEMNPYTLKPNPYDDIPHAFVLYRSAYPIRYNKESNVIKPTPTSTAINMRIHQLSVGALMSLSNNAIDCNYFDCWREVEYYRWVDSIVKKKISPNFVNLILYVLDGKSKITFDKLIDIKKVKNMNSYKLQINNNKKIPDFGLTLADLNNYNISNAPPRLNPNNNRNALGMMLLDLNYLNKNLLLINNQLNNIKTMLPPHSQQPSVVDVLVNSSTTLLVTITEAPNTNFIKWCSKIYKSHGTIQKMISTGYHKPIVWKSILFQLLYACAVLEKHNICINDFSLENNIYIKDIQTDNTGNSCWVYKINNIEYYIPNYGYVVVVDVNNADIKTNAGNNIEFKIYGDIYGSVNSNKKDFGKIMNNQVRNIFSNINNFTNSALYPNMNSLDAEINTMINNIAKEINTTSTLIDVFPSCFQVFFNNKIGKLLTKLEKENFNILNKPNYIDGSLMLRQKRYDEYDWVLYVGKDNLKRKIIYQDNNGQYNETSVFSGSLFSYPDVMLPENKTIIEIYIFE